MKIDVLQKFDWKVYDVDECKTAIGFAKFKKYIS